MPPTVFGQEHAKKWVAIKSLIHTSTQTLHDQQISRIKDRKQSQPNCGHTEVLSQVLGACGMNMVQHQWSSALRSDLYYKNKDISHFKKMKTLGTINKYMQYSIGEYIIYRGCDEGSNLPKTAHNCNLQGIVTAGSPLNSQAVVYLL
jgi:hypothetical protein